MRTERLLSFPPKALADLFQVNFKADFYLATLQVFKILQPLYLSHTSYYLPSLVNLGNLTNLKVHVPPC